MNDRYLKLKDAVNVVRNTVAEGTLESTLELRLLDKSLTADVRENVKGEWIRCQMARMDKDESIIYYRNWKCNVCGYASNEEYDYCPYCGARMR